MYYLTCVYSIRSANMVMLLSTVTFLDVDVFFDDKSFRVKSNVGCQHRNTGLKTRAVKAISSTFEDVVIGV